MAEPTDDELERLRRDAASTEWQRWESGAADAKAAGSRALWRDGYEKGRADAAPRWIPVGERLPEPDAGGSSRMVLIIYDAGIGFGFWLSASRRWLDDDGTAYGVTHWAPIPEPPQAKEQG